MHQHEHQVQEIDQLHEMDSRIVIYCCLPPKKLFFGFFYDLVLGPFLLIFCSIFHDGLGGILQICHDVFLSGNVKKM